MDVDAVTERLRRIVARRLGLVQAEEPKVEGLRRLTGGASQETWRFTVNSGDTSQDFILRKAPADSGSERRAGLFTEAQLLRATAAHGVPVPHLWAMLEPNDGLGDGFLMEFIDGETLGGKIVRDPRLSDARLVLAHQCGAAMAAIHRIPTNSLPALREDSAEATLQVCSASFRSAGQYKPVFETALQWLGRNLPVGPQPQVLVHGDFRNGNLMVGPEGLRAVLDWELAHLGDPMEDLAWICVNSWRFGGALPVGGFGTREDLFAGYESAGGVVDPARVHFWEVLGVLKWGVTCEAMSRPGTSGGAIPVERAVIGRRSSETEIDLLSLLAPRRGQS